APPAEDRAAARATRRGDRTAGARGRRPAAGLHGRHRARRRSRRARALPARGPGRPTRRASRAGARRRAPAAGQRHRAHAAARRHHRRARSPARRRARCHPRRDRTMSALFVTGTDTGVGRTYVAFALPPALRASGRRVRVMKPVETGVTDEPSDASLLRDAAGDPASLDEICPYRLRAPLAPSVAARLEGVTIDLGRIEALIRSRRDGADVLLV